MASDKLPISGHAAPPDAGGQPPRSAKGPVPASGIAPHRQAPRGGIFGAFTTLMAIIPLTVLIWAYADRESVEKAQGLSVQIRLHSSAPDRLVRIVDPSPRTITVNIEGSRAKVEKVRSQLASGGEEGMVNIAVPPDFPEGKTTPLTLQRQIEDAPIFKNNAIAVTSCQPAGIDIRADHLVTRTVRPGLRRDVASRIIGKIVFDPPVVTLRGPQSALRDVAGLDVYADPPESDLPTTAIEHDIPDVPVRLGRTDETITITPSTVKISIRVKESNVTYEIPTVPVFVRKPSTIEDRYRVLFPNGALMSRITVEGPEDQIATIRNETFRPEATLNIVDADVRTQLPKVPSYTLPPRVTVSDKDKARTIDFRLLDRNVPE